MRIGLTPHKREGAIFLAIMAVLLFTSCLGLTSDVTFAMDGSGTAVMEMRVSALASDMGPGNVSMPSLPLGTDRAAWETLAADGSGITLLSYIERTSVTEKNIIVRFSFRSLDALSTALNAKGRIVSLAQSGNSRTLTFTPLADDFRKDPTIVSLFKDVFPDYAISIRFALKDGTFISSSGTISRDRKEVTLSKPLHELVSAPSPEWLAISF